MKLTRRQQEIFDYLKDFIQENEYPPSVREIAVHFKLASSGGVHKHLKVLEAKKYITLNPNQSRSIRIVRRSEDGNVISNDGKKADSAMVYLPLKGNVAAGVPIDYQLENEEIPFPLQMLRSPTRTFVLKVKGSSMIEECIRDGDYIIVEDRNTAANGEMVVAMLNHEEATLKKFYHEGQQIRLQPANHTMEPIIVKPESVSIQGVVVGVLRNY